MKVLSAGLFLLGLLAVNADEVRVRGSKRKYVSDRPFLRLPQGTKVRVSWFSYVNFSVHMLIDFHSVF